MHVRTQWLTLSALFIALSVLLPVLFHGIGLGPVFLPMFWPVAVGAFFLPSFYAAFVGVLAPLLSMLLTGMPPAPMIYVVLVELLLLGWVTSDLHHRKNWGLFWPLFCGLLASQAAQFVCVIPLAPLLGLPSWSSAAILGFKGLPGLVFMLLLIPAALARIKHRSLF